MSRWLLGVCFVLVIIPHLVPLPESVGEEQPKRGDIEDFKDDGENLPTHAQLERLARSNPVAFLEFCLRRYDREVTGYQLTFAKQERIRGNLEKPEVIDVWFKDQPHSAFLKWRSGARLAARALYVEGENLSGQKSMMLVRPSGLGAFLKSVTRDPVGKDAQNSGRYPLPEFGLKKGLQRTLKSWRTAQESNSLHVEYLGVVKVEELGGRKCFVLERMRFKEPEGDGVTYQKLFIDVETWLLTGTLLKGKDDQVIASYFFRDIQLMPKFAEDQFARNRIEN